MFLDDNLEASSAKDRDEDLSKMAEEAGENLQVVSLL